MDEEEFDAAFNLRPFGTRGAGQRDFQFRRTASLAATLWGKTPDDLRRQLLAPVPEIPSGFDLADFRELLWITEQLLTATRSSLIEYMSRMAFATVVVGGQQYTAWEARREIIYRAIEYLERH